jgi:hypothetical protein
MGRSKLDSTQIFQHVYNEEKEAFSVDMLPTEMSIELNADDGDSVIARREMEVLDVSADEIIATSKHSRMSVTVETEIKMVVSGIEISLGILAPGQVKEICSPEIIVILACKVVLQS